LPQEGVLSANSHNAHLNIPYSLDILIYTLDRNLCGKNYNDSFTYKVLYTNMKESTESTLNINAINTNEPPIEKTVNITAEKSSESLIANFSATDPENGPITYSEFNNNGYSWISQFNSNGQITLIPKDSIKNQGTYIIYANASDICGNRTQVKMVIEVTNDIDKRMLKTAKNTKDIDNFSNIANDIDNSNNTANDIDNSNNDKKTHKYAWLWITITISVIFIMIMIVLYFDYFCKKKNIGKTENPTKRNLLICRSLFGRCNRKK